MGRLLAIWLVAVVATVGLTGCLGGQDEAVDAASVPEAAEQGEQAGDESGEPSSPAPADETDSDEARDNGTAEADEDQATVEATTEIDWEGNLGTWVCAPRGPGVCGGPILTSADDFEPLDIPGNGTTAELALTWTPVSPVTEELTFMLVTWSSCGDGCYSTERVVAEAEGPSPLSLSSQDLAFQGPAEGYLLAVRGGLWHDQPPLFFGASHEQPFRATGTITSLVDA